MGRRGQTRCVVEIGVQLTDVQKVCRGQDSAQVGNQMDECSKLHQFRKRRKRNVSPVVILLMIFLSFPHFECGPDILAEKDREIETEEAIELANNRIHVWLKQILVLCGLSTRLGLITVCERENLGEIRPN